MQIPDLINITEAIKHDRYGLEQNIFAKNIIIIEDRSYFDFTIMLNRILAENTFVTRIKTNIVFESVAEFDLPEDKDQDILKD